MFRREPSKFSSLDILSPLGYTFGMSTIEALESPVIVDFTEASQEDSLLIDQLSEPIVGKWNVLVSQTNWEKGALILSWRNELVAAGLPHTTYSDESWARRVGTVTPQHTGRLRRVAERFGERHKDFAKLYWSHFNAALDWDDAELWLEGAVQNDWSVAQMRVQRWEVLGGDGAQKPHEENILVTEVDVVVYSQHTLPPEHIEGRNVTIGVADVEDLENSSISMPSPVADPPQKKEQPQKNRVKQIESNGSVPATGELLMSLRGISQFPSDLAEPLELLKVAILNHRLAGWKSVSAEQVRQSLDTLKMLLVAED